jgi:hypothetical protein
MMPFAPLMVPIGTGPSSLQQKRKNAHSSILNSNQNPLVAIMEPAHVRNRHHHVPPNEIEPIPSDSSTTTLTPESSDAGEAPKGEYPTEHTIVTDAELGAVDSAVGEGFTKLRGLLAKLGRDPFSTNTLLDNDDVYNNVIYKKRKLS